MPSETVTPALTQPLVVSMDLDETLISSSIEKRRGWQVDAALDLGPGHLYYTSFRPGAQELMLKLLDEPDRFQVGVFTAASKDYAEAVLCAMIGEDRLGELVFLLDGSRTTTGVDRMCRWGGAMGSPLIEYKNIRKIEKVARAPKSRIIAVDDRPEIWARSYGNLLAVPAFVKREPRDSIMKGLRDSLELLWGLEDVRPIEKRGMVKNRSLHYGNVFAGADQGLGCT